MLEYGYKDGFISSIKNDFMQLIELPPIATSKSPQLSKDCDTLFAKPKIWHGIKNAPIQLFET